MLELALHRLTSLQGGGRTRLRASRLGQNDADHQTGGSGAKKGAAVRRALIRKIDGMEMLQGMTLRIWLEE